MQEVPFDPTPSKDEFPAPKQRRIRSLTGPAPDQEAPAEEPLSYAEKLGQLPADVIVPTWDTEKKRPRPGFRHQGRTVALGEVIECDLDIARSLVRSGKAEFVQ